MLVFVYGTLTDPDRVTALLEDGPGEYAFVGRATLEGFHRVDGRYPTLSPGGSVDGRLLSVDEAALARLDRYEGVDRGLYVRVAASRSDGETVWVYVGDPTRLGIETDVGWPKAESFHEACQSYLLNGNSVVRSRE